MRRTSRLDVVNNGFFQLTLMTVWVIACGWAVANYLLGAYLACAVMTAGSLLISPAILVLHRLGRTRLATHLLVFAGVCYIVCGAEFICADGGFEYYFLAGTPIAVLMFKPDRWKDLAAAVSMVFVGFALTKILPVPAGAWYLPARPPVDVMRDVNFAMAYALIFVLVYGHLSLSLRQRRDLHRAFERSRETEDLLLRTLENMREGVMVQDETGRVIRHNTQVNTFLGTTGDAWRAFGADDRAIVEAELPPRLAARTGTAQVDQTLRVTRPDGVSRWLNVNSIPFTLFRNGVARTHVLTTMLDVTTRKASEDLLLQIVNSTSDWIFIKDRAHRYLVVNDSYAKSLKRAPADIVGRTDLDLGFPTAIVRGDAERGIRGFWTDDELVLSSGRLHVFENDPVMLDGSMHTFHTIKTPVFAAGAAEPYGVLGFARDITTLKEVERQLVESSKMASLGQMAGGIAHEINNPLAVIDGRSRLLLHQLRTQTFDPKQATEALGRIVATVDRIAKIVKGLKTFARGADGDQPERIGLAAVVEDSVALCAERFHGHATPLEVARFDDVFVHGQAAQLAQVLINLLNNAFDAVADAPGRWVRVDVSATESLAVISVTDSGAGIPPAVAERLAQPFFTTKPVGQGTGLGLMISRRIIEHHGGRLFLDARAANTRFVIELPRAESAAAGRVA